MKKLSQINETSWGGMVRRSNTEKQVRKEDDINSFGVDEFYEYLTNHYKTSSRWHMDKEHNLNPNESYIRLPVCGSDNFANCLTITYDKYNNIKNIHFNKDLFLNNTLEDVLKTDYNIIRSGKWKCNIYPKNEELCNRTFINILNIIIQNIDDPYIEKVK